MLRANSVSCGRCACDLWQAGTNGSECDQEQLPRSSRRREQRKVYNRRHQQRVRVIAERGPHGHPPRGISFVSQSQTMGPAFTLANSGDQINNTIATLPAGTSATFQVVAHVSPAPHTRSTRSTILRPVSRWRPRNFAQHSRARLR